MYTYIYIYIYISRANAGAGRRLVLLVGDGGLPNINYNKRMASHI